MSDVTLGDTGITTSQLGLGCAELFREPSPAKRRRLLDTALHAGIRHFDVAPMYGLGIAERELGRFARTHRDQVVLATKFGISAAPAARALSRVQGPIRRVLASVPAARTGARSAAAGPGSGPAGSLLYTADGWSAASARAGLERSLRELMTDYIDVLLLHDPEPGRVDGSELCAYLEQQRTAGRIRAWGVAGEREPATAVAGALPVTPGVLQARADILAPAPPAAAGPSARISFGVLGRAIAAIGAHLSAEPARATAWHTAVGIDCGDPAALAGLLLAWASRSNPEGVVLFGTIQPDHITAAATAVAEPQGNVDALAELVARELPQTW